MAEEHIDLSQILNNLISPNDEDRQTAEREYQVLDERQKLAGLADLLLDERIRFRGHMFSAFVQYVGHELCDVDLYDAVVAMARQCISDRGNHRDASSEILEFLFECAENTNALLQVAALRIFTEIPIFFQNLFLLEKVSFKQMIQRLISSNSNQVKFWAVSVIGAIIDREDMDNVALEEFGDLLPHIIFIAFTGNKSDLLELLISLIENCPKFMLTQMDLVIEMCYQVSSNSVDTNTRYLITFIVNITNN